jgi:hypothetical protein
MVPKTGELLPEPETPGDAVRRRLEMSAERSLRLFTRAPWTRIRSWLSAGRRGSAMTPNRRLPVERRNVRNAGAHRRLVGFATLALVLLPAGAIPISNALLGGGTARRGWLKFRFERRFASVSVVMRPLKTSKLIQTDVRWWLGMSLDVGSALAGRSVGACSGELRGRAVRAHDVLF